MKNIFKRQSVIIPIVLITVVLIILGACFLLFKDDEKKENKVKKEGTFVAYVKINPLVKFTFNSSYYECTDKDKTKICGEYSSTVESVELLNDEAKELYKDVDFKGKSLDEGISLLASIAFDKKINLDSISITTNWNYKLDEIKNKVTDDLKLKADVNVTFNYKEELNEAEIIKNNTTKKYSVIFNTDGGSKIENQKVKENETISKPKDPTKNGYIFAGWTLDGKDFNFSTKVTSDLTLKAKWNKKESSSTKKEPSGNTGTTESSGGQASKPANKPADSTAKLGKNEYYTVKDGKIRKYTFTFTEKTACEKGGDSVAYDTVYPVKPYMFYGCDEIKDANGNIKWGVYYMETTDANSKFYY